MVAARTGAALLVLGLVSGVAACADGPVVGKLASAPSVRTPTPSPTPTTNGIDTLPPYDAQVAVRTAFLKAPTMRMHGTGGEGTVIDVRTSANGDATGSVRVDGMRMDFLVIGRTVWLTGNRAFWARGLRRKQVPSEVTGMYLKSTLGSRRMRDLKVLTTRAEFAAGWPTDGIPDGRERVNGVEAYRFRDLDSGEVMFVALTGEPYPLKVTDDEGQTIEFVASDKPLTVEPPDSEDVVAVLR